MPLSIPIVVMKKVVPPHIEPLHALAELLGNESQDRELAGSGQ